MKNIVCKFGGTSLSCSENIKKVYNITKQGGQKFIVLSAPGKRYEKDTKITDSLISIWEKAHNGENFDSDFVSFKNRFEDIAKELDVDINLTPLFDEILQNLLSTCDYHYVISRGEYLMARIFAKFTGFEFLDAKDFILFDDKGEVDLLCSYQKFVSKTKKNKRYVIPGFYGADKSGKIKTFSRGGSDITGAIVSVLSRGEVYQNYTDVDGVMTTNPNLCQNAKVIQKLSYREMRILSYMGANVLHPNCTKFLKENNITLNLRNTFNPCIKGTFILPDKKIKRKKLVGISGKTGLSMINLSKFGVHNDFSSLSQIQEIFDSEQTEIFFVHIDIDNVSLIVENASFAPHKEKIISCLVHIFDEVKIVEKVSLISIVGGGIEKKGVRQKILSKIYTTITPFFVIAPPNNLSITFAILETQYEPTICSLHSELFKQKR